MKPFEARRQEKWNAVANQITDACYREQREAELLARRAELLAQGLIDSDCRYARLDLRHECRNRDDQPLRPWSSCWQEAVAQMRQAAELEREAAQRNLAPAQRNLAPLPPYEPPAGLPKYRVVEDTDDDRAAWAGIRRDWEREQMARRSVAQNEGSGAAS